MQYDAFAPTHMRVVRYVQSLDNQRRLVVAVVALALALRIPGIVAQSYWIDEFITADAVRLPWADMYHRLLFGVETHPLLYATVLKLWTLVFGCSKIALRLFSVAAGGLFVYYCHRLAARLVSREVAFATALVAAMSPYAIYYAQEVRSYMLFALLTTAAYTYFFEYIDTRSRTAYLFWITATALAFQTHVYGAFVLAAEGLYALFEWRRRKDRSLFIDQLAGCVIVALTFLPWMAVILLSKADYVTGAKSLGYQQPIGIGHLAYAFYAIFFGYSLGPSVEELHHMRGLRACLEAHGAITCLAILSVLPVVVLGARKIWLDPRARAAIMIGAGVPVAAAFGVSLMSTIAFNVRFIIPILPFILMIVGAGLAAIVQGDWRAKGILGIGFAAIIMISLQNYYTNPKYWREDYERTAAFLRTEPTIRVLAGAFPATLQGLVADRRVSMLSPAEFSTIQPGENCWLVWNRTWVFDHDNSLRQETAAQCRILSVQRYSGFEVELCQKKSD